MVEIQQQQQPPVAHLDEKERPASAGHSDDESTLYVKPRQNGIMKIEAMTRALYSSKFIFGTFLICMSCVIFAFTLQNGTYYTYQIYATSEYEDHSTMLGVIGTAGSIIKAVSQPTIAKISDVWSRQVAYLVGLIFFLVGFIVTAAAPTANGYAVGQILGAIGFEAIYLITNVILCDISPLKWRALANAITSVWYIVTCWVAANVAKDVLSGIGWRWGYGIFCIIMPAAMAPTLLFLYWASWKAKKSGDLVVGARGLAREGDVGRASFATLCKRLFVELDLGGLILLSFGWCLFLLPFSLYTKAKGEFANPSIIAMLVCGPVILVLFGLYEWKVSPKPVITSHILINRTFQLAVVIDFFFYLTGYLRNLYYLSWIYGVTDWSLLKWTYFSNLNTFLLSVFGILIAIAMRYMHRYKYLQLTGLGCRIIALGLVVMGTRVSAPPSLALLVWQQLLNTFGGSASAVGTQVASQASVPHQDLAQVIAQLALWTQIGGAIGEAISAAVWSGNLPKNMRKYGVPEAQVKTLAGSNVKVHALAYDSAVRKSAIQAYNATIQPLFITALALAFIPLVAGIFMPNYYLGDRHNVVEEVNPAGQKTTDAGDSSRANQAARDEEAPAKE